MDAPTVHEVETAIVTLTEYINSNVPTATKKRDLQTAIEETPGGLSAMQVLSAFVADNWE